MRAGRLRHRCILARLVREQNKSGGFTETWLPVGEIWAEVTLPTGRVTPVAEQLQATVTAEIRIRPRKDTAAGWRITEKRTGVTYKVEAALLNNERDMLRLLCSSVPNP
ncbi:phage head closure protein [Pseudomonas fluorescens]|jgi:SPP1 family predicted phage head-tail adaptor|uniref:phage head closure protein n=1 Tax=Pseudomonas fluorescens TaxID=294 RepID=UPI0020C56E3C|nr:phage head closure protein [Pseudomonas fluorescens]UTL92466.1 phage head closure protein [Pseudomonas fluorescens]